MDARRKKALEDLQRRFQLSLIEMDEIGEELAAFEDEEEDADDEDEGEGY
jgi:hypothetical protein